VTGVSVQDTDQESIDVVLGTTVTPVTPPSSLAFTGGNGVLQMAGVALLLLLLGTGILFLTRRREDGTEA
jgi:LPXTG-motif cell wall-anchored protein